MNKSIEARFQSAVEKAARAACLDIKPDQVAMTLELVNLARGRATKCFRLRLPRGKSALQGAQQLRDFRKNFSAKHTTGADIEVECVLSGAIVGGKMLDWEGNLVDTLG